MDLSQRALQFKEKFFSNFKLVMCYISLDSLQRYLQTNGTFFFKFRTSFRILTENQFFFKRIARREILIKLQCVYISMDSSRQAQRTNGKLFFQISNSFLELVTIFKNNSGVGIM